MPTDDIARLYDFTAGTTIVSNQVDQELNQIVTSCNGKAGRDVANTFTGANTFTAANSFTETVTLSGATPLKTDSIAERTAAAGVTVDSVLLKDGMVTVSGTPSVAGQIGYASNVLTYYNGSAVKTLATTDSSVNPKGYINGPAPVYTSASTVTFKAGLKARDSANAADIELTADVPVSLASAGAAGLDSGSEAANTWYYYYLIRKSGDGTCSVMASTVNESVTGSITLPTGYDQKRQLPFCVKNDNSSNVIPFSVSGGWARPFIQLDVTETRFNGTSIVTGTANVLNGGTSGAFTAVSLASYVPPISKLARVYWLNNSTSSSTFYGRLRTDSGMTNPRAINGFYGLANNYALLPTTSSQAIEYIRDAGAAGLILDVVGFEITEVN